MCSRGLVFLCVTLTLFVSVSLAEPNLLRKFGSPVIRAVDGAGVQRVTGRDTETCTPDSDEYNDRVSALQCDEDYQRAVRAEIERSVCKNGFYDREFSDDDDTCEPFDDRENVANCSGNCSITQFYYVFCTANDEELMEIDRECGVNITFCQFDNEGICFLKNTEDHFYKIHEECYDTDSDENVVNGVCTGRCKEAVEDLKDFVGCCLRFFLRQSDGPSFDEYGTGTGDDVEEKVLLNLFSVCGVEVPEICKDPSDDIVDCAHPSNATVTAAPPSSDTPASPSSDTATVISSFIHTIFIIIPSVCIIWL